MLKRMQDLIKELNTYRDSYYNDSVSLVSDREYDKLFDELQILEKETGTVYSNSPTQTVGYEIRSQLREVKHNHPMLSLDKTKSVDDVKMFLNNKLGVGMLKMDGLTISLRYVKGKLVSAETRGNGEIGEDVLHTVKTFTNVPLTIDWEDELIVDGEAIITWEDFEVINKPLIEKAIEEATKMGLTGKEFDKYIKDNSYANPRNLASGSTRLLDAAIASERKLQFIAWKVVKGIANNSFRTRLMNLKGLGFTVVPYSAVYPDPIDLGHIIRDLTVVAIRFGYPIDGLVFGFDDVAYGDSLGATGHHLKSQLAFKFEDEVYETELLAIDWTMGKTGVLTPTAIFEPVEIDGTIVERASVHNVSILTELDLQIGDRIEVYKANQIIPQIKRNISAEERKESTYIALPAYCPICEGYTEVKQDNESKVLVCTNPNCKGKLLGKLTHFCSKNAMDIDGLSEATLEKFIELGWVNEYKDLYNLSQYKERLMRLEGFGKKSVEKLLKAIEDSRTTTLERFIYSLSIPLIGRTASKAISKACKGSMTEFLIKLTGEQENAFRDLEGF